MFTHHLQRPVGFVIISATLTEVVTVTGLPVLVICTVVPKSARATLAMNGRQRRGDGDGCNFRSWAQAGAEPAIHGGSRDQWRDVKGETGVKRNRRGGERKRVWGASRADKASGRLWWRKNGEVPFWTVGRHEASSEWITITTDSVRSIAQGQGSA